MSEWQKCPICGGNGMVSGGFYDHPGDYNQWTSDHVSEVCRCCKGEGIIKTLEEKEVMELGV